MSFLRLGLPVLALFSSLAFATLGEHEDSVAADQKLLRAEHEFKTQNGLTVHVLNFAGGQVKEFVNASGVVFAIAWQGSHQPNLQNLFGTYYSEYASAATAPEQKRVGRQPFKATETSRLIVHRGGHMRDLHGQVYSKDLLPSGVKPEDLH